LRLCRRLFAGRFLWFLALDRHHLQSLVEDARIIRNVLHNLHSRYNRKVIEQAAIAGVLSPNIIGNVETANAAAD
jgi:DNA gyrase subunit B